MAELFGTFPSNPSLVCFEEKSKKRSPTHLRHLAHVVLSDDTHIHNMTCFHNTVLAEVITNLIFSPGQLFSVIALRSSTGLELEADRQRFPETFSTSSLDESCDGDVEDEMLPELVDNPGTTRGTKLSVLQMVVSSLLWSTVASDR